jgi:drug/metabolite transporter (DMT)-like permease
VETQQLYLGATGTFLLLPFALWLWVPPSNLLELALMAALGISGWIGHQFLTNAHRFAPANTLMPYTYSFMIYITAFSWLIFGHVPDIWVMVGALIIVLSGLVIWKREQRR